MSGVAYYTVERDGFRVVAALAKNGEDAVPVRVAATPAPGQSLTLSIRTRRAPRPRRLTSSAAPQHGARQRGARAAGRHGASPQGGRAGHELSGAARGDAGNGVAAVEVFLAKQVMDDARNL